MIRQPVLSKKARARRGAILPCLRGTLSPRAVGSMVGRAFMSMGIFLEMGLGVSGRHVLNGCVFHGTNYHLPMYLSNKIFNAF
ncbi:hypothetical protein [Moraxella lacunata]|uniref:hypothetical protein n=1 Tax=Moraxella lacunata TaxID=477 RepID=UPI003EE20C7B